GPKNWAIAGGSNGYRAALMRLQLTPGLISSLPRTGGLLPSISFSTSYPELDSAARRPMRRIGNGGRNISRSPNLFARGLAEVDHRCESEVRVRIYTIH